MWSMVYIRGIRTIAKFRLLTKIDFNIMHLVILCNFFLAKIANSWLKRPPKFTHYYTQPQFWRYRCREFGYDFFVNFLLLLANLVDQNQLGAFLLHSIVKNWKNVFQIDEFMRSLEPWICNFCQKFLHRSTKCNTLKSIFVNNLNLAIVRIPLVLVYIQ